MPGGDPVSDVDRVRAHYAECGARYAERWAEDRPEVQYAWSRLREELRDAFARAGIELGGARILDLGCGTGRVMAWLIEERAGDVLGVDVVVPRVREARRRAPVARLAIADGARLPLRDGVFDAALALTTLSSMPSEKMRRAAVAELLRVLRPGGAVICYEFSHGNPLNPHTVGLGARRLRALFAGANLSLRRVTLHPVLLRTLRSLGPRWLAALERFRFLRSHCLAVVTKATPH